MISKLRLARNATGALPTSTRLHVHHFVGADRLATRQSSVLAGQGTPSSSLAQAGRGAMPRRPSARESNKKKKASDWQRPTAAESGVQNRSPRDCNHGARRAEARKAHPQVAGRSQVRRSVHVQVGVRRCQHKGQGSSASPPPNPINVRGPGPS